MHWHCYDSAEQAAESCCRHLLMQLDQALLGKGLASLAISGGSTPKLLFRAMAAAQFDWHRVHLFWVDERMVPPADAESNYRLAEEHLLKPAHFPHRNVHRIHGELRPDVAAQKYVAEIQDFFALEPGALPHFDAVQLGLGNDAHTASLFPGEPLIDDREKIAAAVLVEKLARWRVTLLPGTLVAARHVSFLVAGADKKEALRSVIEAPYEPHRYPAQVVSHHSRQLSWFVDREAAALVSL